jgi:hypothetical protein
MQAGLKILSGYKKNKKIYGLGIKLNLKFKTIVNQLNFMFNKGGEGRGAKEYLNPPRGTKPTTSSVIL